MIPRPDERGYLVIDERRAAPPGRSRLASARAALRSAGWREAGRVDEIQVWRGPRARLPVVQVHRAHLLIGAYHGRDRPLAAAIGVSRSAFALAQAAVDGGWGRYVLAWREPDGRLALLRDPSGALDCLWWRRDGLVAAGDHLPDTVLDLLAPEGFGIDWTTLGEIADSPNLLSARAPLDGLNDVGAGDLVLVGDEAERLGVWRPAAIVRRARTWDETPASLRAAVDAAVARLAAGHERLLGEISGGLDSAIVSSSLAHAGLVDQARFVNYYGDGREGDERRYAAAAAAQSGCSLTYVRKPVEPLTLDALEPLAWSFRPALQGVDAAYDQDMARRMRAQDATGLLSGQGGDAVFFQASDPQVVVDRARREGLRGLDPGYWAEVARWTRHSAWTLAALALRPRRRPPTTGRRHPWVEDADDLPPAKAGQVLRLANCQLFWGDCLRARAGDLLQPLLSQPVMEHCLAIPVDRLTIGARDRGLARAAFRERLPDTIVQRRDKGDLSRFYGQVAQASLGDLRPLLLDGLLACHGLLDKVTLERELSREHLIWSPQSNRPLLLAVLEVWARHWLARTEAIRRAQIAFEPIEDVAV